jgi:hypothetical protein
MIVHVGYFTKWIYLRKLFKLRGESRNVMSGNRI